MTACGFGAGRQRLARRLGHRAILEEARSESARTEPWGGVIGSRPLASAALAPCRMTPSTRPPKRTERALHRLARRRARTRHEDQLLHALAQHEALGVLEDGRAVDQDVGVEAAQILERRAPRARVGDRQSVFEDRGRHEVHTLKGRANQHGVPRDGAVRGRDLARAAEHAGQRRGVGRRRRRAGRDPAALRAPQADRQVDGRGRAPFVLARAQDADRAEGLLGRLEEDLAPTCAGSRRPCARPGAAAGRGGGRPTRRRATSRLRPGVWKRASG